MLVRMGAYAYGEEWWEEEERWITHYSSSHRILLVGDGDFSFSLSLARAFGDAANIVATSLDSYETLMKKYKEAHSNLGILKLLGAHVLHGVDATKMRLHTDLQMQKFDRIIFNFPHAGFYAKEGNSELIKMHKSVVRGFFRNASGMLRPDGEIHVNHKMNEPFCLWDLDELAGQSSLFLRDCVDFKREDYPGYNNKRGAGPRADEPFPLKDGCTYKYKLIQTSKSFPHISKAQRRPPQALEIPVTYLPRETRMPFTVYVENRPGYGGPVRTSCRILDEYFTHVISKSGRPDYDVYYSTRESLRIYFEIYMREEPGRKIDDYIRLLREQRLFHVSRMAKHGLTLNSNCQPGARKDLDFFHNILEV